MSTKRLRLMTLIGVILITAVIAAGLLLTYVGHDRRTVELPPAPDAVLSPGGTSEGTPSDGLERLNITVENVQNVVKTLRRTDSYSRKIKVEEFYTGSASGTKAADYDIDVYMYGGALSMKMTGGNDVKHIIITGGWMYVWYKADTDYYRTAAQKAVYSENAADEFQMILSYEDVLKAPKENILEADNREYGGENCIYVRYKDGLMGYITVCYISTASGLLAGAEQYDGNERMVYRMTTSDYTATAPALSVFDLPDGTNAVGNF